MIKSDWFFESGDYICNFRSTGVLIRDNKILVQREKDGNEYSLPGGHVQIGETSIYSLIREFKEETGADIEVEQLLWTEESFWKWKNKNTNTIVFYYLISLKEGSDIPDFGEFVSQKDNCGVLLGWTKLDKLDSIKIYPSFLSNKIRNIENCPEHFITYE